MLALGSDFYGGTIILILYGILMAILAILTDWWVGAGELLEILPK